MFGRLRASRSADHRPYIERSDDYHDPDEYVDGCVVAGPHAHAGIDPDGYADIVRGRIGIALCVPVTDDDIGTHELAAPNGVAAPDGLIDASGLTEPGQRVADLSV